jgi:hypothetical protein
MSGTEQPDSHPDEATSAENWPESPELSSAEPSAREMADYAATIRRIERMIVAAGVVCAAGVVIPLGWPLALGVLAGAAMAWLNFRWLAATVNAIGARIVHAHSRERGAAIVVRGIGRILLMAIAAYVIFTCSVRGLLGFLAGLAMPVIAVMCEAVYEFVAGFRRTS